VNCRGVFEDTPQSCLQAGSGSSRAELRSLAALCRGRDHMMQSGITIDTGTETYCRHRIIFACIFAISNCALWCRMEDIVSEVRKGGVESTGWLG
jgi:hypothetical protein